MYITFEKDGRFNKFSNLCIFEKASWSWGKRRCAFHGRGVCLWVDGQLPSRFFIAGKYQRVNVQWTNIHRRGAGAEERERKGAGAKKEQNIK